MATKNILIIVITILLAFSLSYNVYQYKSINRYEDIMNAINSDVAVQINFLSRSLKNHEVKDSELRMLSSITGSIFYLSRCANSYNNDELKELVEHFTYLNNVFIIGNLNVINKYSVELSDILDELYENPKDESTREKFIIVVKKMLNESKKE